MTAFPVVGNVTYIDDWHDARPGGWHEGNDIMSVRHQPAVAFEAGRVDKMPGSGGCMLELQGVSGMVYWYIHLNNDLGPDNDNKGGCKNGVAYAKGLADGDKVRRGELVGFVGDSGDANGITPHLHFEVHRPNRKVDPFKFLNKATHLLFPRPRPGLGDVTLTLKGAKVMDKTSSAITVRTKRVVVQPLGLSYIFRRKVTLTVPPEAAVARKNGSSLDTTDVTSAKVGERVRMRTLAFTPTWATQKAPAESISAAKILLLG